MIPKFRVFNKKTGSPIEFNKYRFEADGFWRNWQDDPGDFFSEGAYKEYEVTGNRYMNPELLEAT